MSMIDSLYTMSTFMKRALAKKERGDQKLIAPEQLSILFLILARDR